MYAKHSAQLSEAPSQEKDVNTFILTPSHKLPVEAPQWEGFLLLTCLNVSDQTAREHE